MLTKERYIADMVRSLSFKAVDTPRRAWGEAALVHIIDAPESYQEDMMGELYRAWPEVVQYGAEHGALRLQDLAKAEISKHTA
jgi:hypothetical protein